MKLSLFSFLLLSCSLSFAQLSVQNNAYIFVKNQYLYVTDDVNINDTDSKIYLRDEAQLLQGDGLTGNSGVGQLSVYQTGTANQWSYNYWCSPVGNNSAAFGNEPARVNLIDAATGIPTANDPLGLTSSTDALFTSSYDGSSSPLTISERWLWTFQTSTNYADWMYVGSSGAILPGLGFTMKGNGTNDTGSQRYDFRGKPNNGTITNNVVNGLNTLIGNPYPSALDAAAFIHDSDNQAAITGTLLYWEQDGSVNSHILQEYRGGYYAFTIDATGTVITDSPAEFMTYDEQDNTYPLSTPQDGVKSARRYIPIGQGFMIEGAAGTISAPAMVYTKNEHRAFAKVSDGNSYFFRNQNDNETQDDGGIQYQANGLPIVPSDFKRFRINVDFAVNGTFFTKQLLLNFHDTATAGFDYGLELKGSSSSANDAYFSLGDVIYLAQAYPFETELSIPITLTIEAQQPLRFRIFDIQNFEVTQSIYLHDTATNTYTDLRANDYELDIAPGLYTDRFEIVFATENTLDINHLDSENLSIKQLNKTQEVLVENPTGLDVQTISLYDVLGKQVVKQTYTTTDTQYSIPTSHLSNGVYVVHISTRTQNALKTQKIIIKH